MTVPGAPAVTVRKPKWKQRLPEIPATRFSCITSGSLRPKLGLSILATVIVFAVCFVLVPLVNSPTKMAALAHSESVKAIANANQEFTGKLFSHLIADLDKQANLVASPFSISSVLAMALAGARGSTADQMRSALAFPEDRILFEGFKTLPSALKSGKNFTLEVGTRVYSQSGYTLLDSFSKTVKYQYHAKPEQVDFKQSPEASRVSINSWVENATQGKIKDLLPQGSIQPLTRLVLVNAIYFKGDWATKFDRKDTTNDTFHVSPQKKVRVMMMHMKGKEFRGAFDKKLNADILELPYKGKQLSMLLLLPARPKDFEDLEAKFATDLDLVGLELSHEVKYNVDLPRFKLESSLDLVKPLEAIGMRDAFSIDAADFSGISGSNDLYVSNTMQKALIEVNEEGSEAAAATAVVLAARSLPRYKKFVCNRPFLFAIKDNLSGMVLFTGRVVNPAA